MAPHARAAQCRRLSFERACEPRGGSVNPAREYSDDGRDGRTAVNATVNREQGLSAQHRGGKLRVDSVAVR
jgi:hypothetical protein